MVGHGRSKTIATTTPTRPTTIRPSQPTKPIHTGDSDAPPARTHLVHTANVVAPPSVSWQQSPQTGERQRAHGPTATACFYRSHGESGEGEATGAYDEGRQATREGDDCPQASRSGKEGAQTNRTGDEPEQEHRQGTGPARSCAEFAADAWTRCALEVRRGMGEMAHRSRETELPCVPRLARVDACQGRRAATDHTRCAEPSDFRSSTVITAAARAP
jgi:hypothetical protein